MTNEQNEPMSREATRYLVMDGGFKAAGRVSALMLDALQQQHPERWDALNVGIKAGMTIAVQFRFSDEAKAVLQVVDDYGRTTDLAEVGVTIRGWDEKARPNA